MGRTKALRVVGLLAVLGMTTATVAAEQGSPPPGSPAATMTISGEQIPPPPQKFGDKIERNAERSKPYRPARVDDVYAAYLMEEGQRNNRASGMTR